MNPLEKYNCLLTAETRPMTQKESELFITLILNLHKLEEQRKEICADAPFAMKVLMSRLPDANLVDLATIIWCSSLSQTPGDAVMWAFTLARIVQKNQFKKITLDDWTCAFPMGVPTDEAKEKIWDAQKGGSFTPKVAADNCLDNPDWWPKMATA